ncbi:MAG TPA: murein biosynthesis integral membrane protein MurJ [Candidatus Saccharimonadales bacterium]|nr:murein biosynthesis integral membrane protein MurJ [Candidatus Saccharimonadales bacterium]
MKPFISRLNRRTTSISAAAVIISASYLASSLLGLLRDRLLVAHFGIGPLTDAYSAAFRLPNLLFTLLVSGAFAVAFIPVFTHHIEKGEQAEAWELSSSLLNILCLTTAAIGIVAFIFAGPITTIITPGFDAYRHELTVHLTRIMLVTPFMFAISSVMGGIAQSFNRFMIYALASVFYNLGIIFGILFLSPSHSIFGVAYGVAIGAALQAGLQIIGLFGLGFRYSFSLQWRNRDVRRVIMLMLPRSIDQGIDQFNYIIETIIGSRLTTGSLAALYYANNLKNVPLSLVGNSIATAAFPRMAARMATGAKEALIRDFVLNGRLILFLVIPSGVVTILMRGYIVRLLYGFGNATTANTLGWFAGTIVFSSLFFLVSRVFYAMQDTRTPLYTSLVSMIATIGFSFWFSSLYGVAGLAMAQSASAAGETLALIIILQRRLGQIGLGEIWRGLWRMLLAGSIMAGFTYIFVAQVFPLYKSDLGFAVVGPKFVILMLVAGVSYLGPCYLLGLREAHQFTRKFKKQIFRPLNRT